MSSTRLCAHRVSMAHRLAPPPPMRYLRTMDIPLAVNGTLMRGLELNANLTAGRGPRGQDARARSWPARSSGSPSAIARSMRSRPCSARRPSPTPRRSTGARDAAGLVAAFDAMAGPDPRDPACSTQPQARGSDALTRGIDGLRIAVAGGHFARLAADEALAAVARVAAALGARHEVSLPEAHRARAAAQVITAAEAGA